MAIPKHIGIILDGNRRYAKERGEMPWEGHRAGAENVRKLFDWCKELGVHEVTMYAFSVKNFKRDPKEVEFLFKLFEEFFSKLMEHSEKLAEEGLRINFVGRISMFPAEMQAKMKELMELTSGNSNYIANFAMAYDGQAEIVDSVKKIAAKVKDGSVSVADIDEEMIKANLYNASGPEVIIRTSGEFRLSGFLLWHSSYSEFFFLDKYWPEFSKEDLAKVVNDYDSRDRRFGK